MKVKSKFSKLMAVGLTLMMLGSLLVMATPASAGTLTVSDERFSTDLRDRVDNILGPANVDIISLAVKGDVMYAATQISTSTDIVSSTNNTLYKSTNGGATWISLYNTTDYPRTEAVRLVAVAPDDANVVAILTGNSTDNSIEVYWSTDGGTKWNDMNIPATGTLRAMDISRGSPRYIAIGGATAGGVPGLWTMKLTIAQSWTQRYDTTTGARVNQETIQAVEFSPNAYTDETITVISANLTELIGYFQVFRLTTGSEKWNNQITREGMTDYGTGLAVGGAQTTALGNAEIQLAPDYLATDQGRRIAYATASGTGGGGGTRRLIDATGGGTGSTGRFDDWTDTGVAGVGWLALSEDGKQLLGGQYANNVAYTWASPSSGSSPNAERLNTLKPPSGANKTLVAWSGAAAMAATSGDESALSFSDDKGIGWNDRSMIDTELDVLDDVAVSADAGMVYLASHDTSDGTTTYDASIWHYSGTAWHRILSRENHATDANAAYLIRVAPKDPTAVYISSVGTESMWVSKNSGLTSWREVPAYPLDDVVDFAVADADTVYAIDASGATKTTNAGASWADKVTLDGLTAKNITLAPNGGILVGGTSYIAFSNDAGLTYTRTVSSPGTGTVYVVADKDYNGGTNTTVYVGVGTAIKRGKAQKATQTWSTRGPATVATITGMASSGKIVYVLSSNATDTTLYRALEMTPTVDTTELALWSSLTKTSFAAQAAPQALRLSVDSKGIIKAWYVNTDDKAIGSTTDVLATSPPTLTTPADKIVIPYNADSGAAFDITFGFTRYSESAIVKMTIQVAADSTFEGLVYEKTDITVDANTESIVIGPNAQNQGSFMPGQTYYWRTRVSADGPLYSPWSTARSFSVKSMDKPMTIVSPANGSSGTSVNPVFSWTDYTTSVPIYYELAVSTFKDFSVLDFSASAPTGTTVLASPETLDYDTTYYWRVRAVTSMIPAKGSTPETPVGAAWVTGAFRTEMEPVAPTPPVVITPPAAPAAPEIKVVQVPTPTPPPAIPTYLLWTIIVIGAVLIIALIVLIVRTRRVT